MRFAGESIDPRIIKSNPAPSSMDPSSLDMTVPEMAPGPYVPGQDLLRDKHILHNPGSGIASARNLREPFPMRQDINRPLNTIPTHPIIGPDGKDKFPGFEIRSVMPRV